MAVRINVIHSLSARRMHFCSVLHAHTLDSYALTFCNIKHTSDAMDALHQLVTIGPAHVQELRMVAVTQYFLIWRLQSKVAYILKIFF